MKAFRQILRPSGLAAASWLMFAPLTAGAQTAPYEEKLLRLGEVLGSLHYLRNLCGEAGNDWRGQMEKLLNAENPSPERKARLVASFNRGYRTFGSVHKTCTEASIAAIDRYMSEGEALSREIVVRYGG